MTESLLLKEYIKKLTHLRRANTAYGKAPHKPVLLLAILDGIEQEWIQENRISITPELVAAFRENWSLLVNTPNSPEFTLPFFHLQSEGYWRLVRFDGQAQKEYVKRLERLREVVDYGTFDASLYTLMQEPTSRAMLRLALLDAYFPITKAHYWQRDQKGGYVHDIENKLLHEPAIAYAREIANADEEEVFVRGGIFKRLVPKVYNYTCCISGMRVISTHDVSLVDACHIVPFSVSHNDTIGNGLSLCPNLHRAFDRGLISVDSHYRLLVSDSFGEIENHPYSLRKLQGKPLALPFDRNFYPAPENLAWHREKVWKGS